MTILGKPLDRVPVVFVKECGYIPSVLCNAEGYIDKYIETKELFQVQGCSNKVTSLLFQLSSPKGFSKLGNVNVHDVIEAVKAFLVGMPEPLLSDDVCDRLIEASQTDNNLGAILVDIHHNNPSHFAILHFMMRLLAKVGDPSNKNGMDVRKLATIFVLDILKPLKIDDNSDVPLSFPSDRMKRLPYLIMVIEHLMAHLSLFKRKAISPTISPVRQYRNVNRSSSVLHSNKPMIHSTGRSQSVPNTSSVVSVLDCGDHIQAPMAVLKPRQRENMKPSEEPPNLHSQKNNEDSVFCELSTAHSGLNNLDSRSNVIESSFKIIESSDPMFFDSGSKLLGGCSKFSGNNTNAVSDAPHAVDGVSKNISNCSKHIVRGVKNTGGGSKFEGSGLRFAGGNLRMSRNGSKTIRSNMSQGSKTGTSGRKCTHSQPRVASTDISSGAAHIGSKTIRNAVGTVSKITSNAPVDSGFIASSGPKSSIGHKTNNIGPMASNGHKASSGPITSSGPKGVSNHPSGMTNTEIRELMKNIVDLAKQSDLIDTLGLQSHTGKTSEQEEATCAVSKSAVQEAKPPHKTNVKKRRLLKSTGCAAPKEGKSVVPLKQKSQNTGTQSRSNVCFVVKDRSTDHAPTPNARVDRLHQSRPKSGKKTSSDSKRWMGNQPFRKLSFINEKSSKLPGFNSVPVKKLRRGKKKHAVSLRQSVSDMADFNSFLPGEEIGPWIHASSFSDTNMDISVLNKTIQEPRVLTLSPASKTTSEKFPPKSEKFQPKHEKCQSKHEKCPPKPQKCTKVDNQNYTHKCTVNPSSPSMLPVSNPSVWKFSQLSPARSSPNSFYSVTDSISSLKTSLIPSQVCRKASPGPYSILSNNEKEFKEQKCKELALNTSTSLDLPETNQYGDQKKCEQPTRQNTAPSPKKKNKTRHRFSQSEATNQARMSVDNSAVLPPSTATQESTRKYRRSKSIKPKRPKVKLGKSNFMQEIFDESCSQVTRKECISKISGGFSKTSGGSDGDDINCQPLSPRITSQVTKRECISKRSGGSDTNNLNCQSLSPRMTSHDLRTSIFQHSMKSGEKLPERSTSLSDIEEMFSSSAHTSDLPHPAAMHVLVKPRSVSTHLLRHGMEPPLRMNRATAQRLHCYRREDKSQRKHSRRMQHVGDFVLIAIFLAIACYVVLESITMSRSL